MMTLLLFDGNALVHRAYHAIPPLTSPDGKLVNAVYGFMTSFLSAVNVFKPAYAAVVFDVAGPTFRDALYKEYKATRQPADQALYDQIPIIKEVLRTLNVPILEKEGFEADDIIATVVARVKNYQLSIINSEIIIVTGDNDALQLVSDNVKVYSLARGVKQAVLYDNQKVIEKYGVPPDKIIDLKALAGDASDNIKGVNGIGPKGAAALINQYGSLEKIAEKIDKVKQAKGDALLAKQIVTMRGDIPLEFDLDQAKLGNYDAAAVEKKFLEFGFKSLLNRLPKSNRVSQTQQGLF